VPTPVRDDDARLAVRVVVVHAAEDWPAGPLCRTGANSVGSARPPTPNHSEWIRRLTGSPAVAARLAQRHSVPLYEAARIGYPERMRVWNRNHPERRKR
jgi:hypothetical protein